MVRYKHTKSYSAEVSVTKPNKSFITLTPGEAEQDADASLEPFK